jgi:antitoxin HicB
VRSYTILLREDKEQGGYWVEVPALPGVYSQGDTLEEALEMIKEAIEGYLEILREQGEPIPTDEAPMVSSVEVAA